MIPSDLREMIEARKATFPARWPEASEDAPAPPKPSIFNGSPVRQKAGIPDRKPGKWRRVTADRKPRPRPAGMNGTAIVAGLAAGRSMTNVGLDWNRTKGAVSRCLSKDMVNDPDLRAAYAALWDCPCGGRKRPGERKCLGCRNAAAAAVRR